VTSVSICNAEETTVGTNEDTGASDCKGMQANFEALQTCDHPALVQVLSSVARDASS
jgi:hypothetical protein